MWLFVHSTLYAFVCRTEPSGITAWPPQYTAAWKQRQSVQHSNRPATAGRASDRPGVAAECDLISSTPNKQKQTPLPLQSSTAQHHWPTLLFLLSNWAYRCTHLTLTHLSVGELILMVTQNQTRAFLTSKKHYTPPTFWVHWIIMRKHGKLKSSSYTSRIYSAQYSLTKVKIWPWHWSMVEAHNGKMLAYH